MRFRCFDYVMAVLLVILWSDLATIKTGLALPWGAFVVGIGSIWAHGWYTGRVFETRPAQPSNVEPER